MHLPLLCRHSNHRRQGRRENVQKNSRGQHRDFVGKSWIESYCFRVLGTNKFYNLKLTSIFHEKLKYWKVESVADAFMQLVENCGNGEAVGFWNISTRWRTRWGARWEAGWWAEKSFYKSDHVGLLQLIVHPLGPPFVYHDPVNPLVIILATLSMVGHIFKTSLSRAMPHWFLHQFHWNHLVTILAILAIFFLLQFYDITP